MGSIAMDNTQVAFIGLGAMGFAMSTHLVRQGVSVTGFDIYEPTLERWQQACQTIKDNETPNASFSTTNSVTSAVKDASIIVLMVATHHHVNSALFDSPDTMKAIKQNTPVVIMSTVPPTYPLEVRQRLDSAEVSRNDIPLVDAPVSGGVARSKNGTLTIMASSNEPSNITAEPTATILATLSGNGKTLFPIPGTLGAGTSAKALNQVQCGIHIVGASEIMSLTAVAGLNTTSFTKALDAPNPSPAQANTLGKVYGWTWMFMNRAPRMLDHEEPIASAVSIINKDVGIIVDEETRLNIELPLLNTANAQLKRIMDAGMASVDDAWITKYYLDPSLSDAQKQSAVVRQTAASAGLGDGQEQKVQQTLLHAHAAINFVSAYETVKFAEALDLLGPKQREMWFTLIAGAAGGSTVFSEVVPVAFAALQSGKGWQEGFAEYAKTVIVPEWDIAGVEELVRSVKQKDATFVPVLLERALAVVKEMS